jgi:hypothetical protein
MELEEKIKKDLIWINQSKIKRLTDSLLCPQRYYMEEITGDLQRYSSEAMLYGNYFEYHATGQLPSDGKIPVIEPLKKMRNGSFIPAAQQRIDLQIKRFPGIMKEYGIKIVKTGSEINMQFNNGIVIFGTLDCLVEWNGQPYIMDLKLTSDVNNTYGDFSWGQFQEKHPTKEGVYVARFVPEQEEGMDIIQPFAYTYMMEKRTNSKWGFIYAVFDHKTNPEFKIIEVEHSEEGRRDMIERLNGTRAKLETFYKLNYKPIPSMRECKGCKHSSCDVRYVEEKLMGESTPLPVQEKASGNNSNQIENPW